MASNGRPVATGPRTHEIRSICIYVDNVQLVTADTHTTRRLESPAKRRTYAEKVYSTLEENLMAAALGRRYSLTHTDQREFLPFRKIFEKVYSLPLEDLETPHAALVKPVAGLTMTYNLYLTTKKNKRGKQKAKPLPVAEKAMVCSLRHRRGSCYVVDQVGETVSLSLLMCRHPAMQPRHGDTMYYLLLQVAARVEAGLQGLAVIPTAGAEVILKGLGSASKFWSSKQKSCLPGNYACVDLLKRHLDDAAFKQVSCSVHVC